MNESSKASPRITEQEIYELERPTSSLLLYYFLGSLLLGPFFIFPIIPLYFRYRTLRYRFDEEGVSMRWGILFRRETNLTYARIQDIHLMSNVVERWLGLARIKIQTASGSAQAEMTIEGIETTDELRDFLYARMRGTRLEGKESTPKATEVSLDAAALEELTRTLQAVSAEVRGLRESLTGTSSVTPEEDSSHEVPAEGADHA